MDSLHLLLDSADHKEWEEWLPSGLFNGITTNPSLLKRANIPCKINNLQLLVDEAERLECHELHLQAWGLTIEELRDSGIAISQLKKRNTNIYVKIPITRTGCVAARILIDSKIPVTFTACFEPRQILIAAALGADYIAPYLKRINNQGRDGKAILIEMQRTLNSINSNCKLLAASIGSINDLSFLASRGINTFTINDEIASELFNVEATKEITEKFWNDAKNYS